ncbi:ADP compounds hydrolase NudE [Alloalcanivorax xenomutans]|jgi:ADP compounds hydrolase|uniref:ADP compounds hydrolase NudE n=1 Tax=Alloalcanivorax xenomutans TaxID=1094342 RepID=A0A9Q3WA91_9GAMM|nr:ADP compounds hydrolase NudE [Alloalcanivorax xenomutans]ERS14707.1 ADP-ribose diphosphatase [Alcanivorax sp. PN-3]KYZ86068.1 ADP compounds hydrolase NudE [Alcanivorax sp. KX64203]MBA4720121.1 ADP compounds hydrolase NudE [Alcanivorax sp.]ARB44434.1 ADP-ribose diphosphatase [Alloalcanivorax xenomutans]MCE7511343.1 ADP compounds hydrolase NudE [Alloalcanivorax xenomutans]|tara:strand:- start:933 stop:1487 length:555 start_codon:yes stop_codon:yes gene_type:complete
MDEQKPRILDTRLVAQSRLFGIEEMHLRFSNGEERTYERLRTPPLAGVMCVPMLDQDTVLLIREYGAGVEEYLLTLPKGAYEHGEDWREAANRELKEEAGHGARKLTFLKRMSLSPGYMGHHIGVVLAEELYEESLPGDEPEPLEVVPWKLSELDRLIERDDMTEARVIAALYMTQRILDQRHS